MPRKINTPEQIINKLREAEIRLSQVVLRSRESNISSKCYPTIYFFITLANIVSVYNIRPGF
jgi:hypothetical protein